MSDPPVKLFSLGDSAVTADFGNGISVHLNNKAIALSNYLEHHSFAGFIESVPAYASTTVYYDISTVRRGFPDFDTALEAVKYVVLKAVGSMNIASVENTRTIEIPVNFDNESALDLEFVAERSGLNWDDVINIFTGTTYRVFMLGFLPGFAYLGEVDERIATPRRESPRLSVPRGSVGIAGKQTGIYSLESPGGWQIIGRTDTEMFKPIDESPCLLAPGDNVRFVAA